MMQKYEFPNMYYYVGVFAIGLHQQYTAVCSIRVKALVYTSTVTIATYKYSTTFTFAPSS